MVKGLARMLAAAAILPLAAPAHAVAEQSFTTAGSITYTWQGDPARGCAAEGLCGVEGALIVQSQGGSSTISGAPPGGAVAIPIDTSGATVRVADGPGGGECIDAGGSPGGGELSFAHRPGGRLVAFVEAQLSSGRCAGPREQDLARLALPVRRSSGKHPSFDLRTSQSFAFGPFTGRVVSTVVVKSIPNPGGSGSVSTRSFPVGPQRHKTFLEQVTLRYRVASLPGSLAVAFSGEPDPFCAVLDSCGASGTLSLTVPGLPRLFVVQASRHVSRRADARQALSDFRRGRLPIGGGQAAPSGAGGIAVTETFAAPGGLRCRSASETPQAQLLLEPRSARAGGGVSLVLNDLSGSDVLRTYCPGPSASDAFGRLPGVAGGPFGPFPAVAGATIGIDQLLARHSVISMTAPGSFAGMGYVGTRSGGIPLSLTLERVRAGTRG